MPLLIADAGLEWTQMTNVTDIKSALSRAPSNGAFAIAVYPVDEHDERIFSFKWQYGKNSADQGQSSSSYWFGWEMNINLIRCSIKNILTAHSKRDIAKTIFDAHFQDLLENKFEPENKEDRSFTQVDVPHNDPVIIGKSPKVHIRTYAVKHVFRKTYYDDKLSANVLGLRLQTVSAILDDLYRVNNMYGMVLHYPAFAKADIWSSIVDDFIKNTSRLFNNIRKDVDSIVDHIVDGDKRIVCNPNIDMGSVHRILKAIDAELSVNKKAEKIISLDMNHFKFKLFKTTPSSWQPVEPQPPSPVLESVPEHETNEDEDEDDVPHLEDADGPIFDDLVKNKISGSWADQAAAEEEEEQVEHASTINQNNHPISSTMSIAPAAAEPQPSSQPSPQPSLQAPNDDRAEAVAEAEREGESKPVDEKTVTREEFTVLSDMVKELIALIDRLKQDMRPLHEYYSSRMNIV